MKVTKLRRSRPGDVSSHTNDPVLAMLGVGRQLWEQEGGDRFVERLRSEDLPEPHHPAQGFSAEDDLADRVWRRIEKHQGDLFHTSRDLPLTFEVEGNGIWFFRNRKRINRKLTRAQVNIAISRCPLKSTTEINDLMDYPYLFAILKDPRIRGQEW